jgi:hypothetical protein
VDRNARLVVFGLALRRDPAMNADKRDLTLADVERIKRLALPMAELIDQMEAALKAGDEREALKLARALVNVPAPQ